MNSKLLVIWERIVGAVKHFFDRSFWIRLLSILFAVVIWASVISGDDATWRVSEANIPVYVIGKETLESRGLALKQDVDELIAEKLSVVSVQLEGAKSAATSLDASALRAVIDLGQILREGKNQEIKITIQGANNLEERRITPVDTITVDVEELYTDENVPVTVVFTGTLPEGYIRPSDERSVLPAQISISGTQSDVTAIKHAYVEIDLTDVTQSINKQYEYVLTDENYNEIDAPTVRVSSPTVIVRSNIYKTKTVPIQWRGSFIGEVADGYVLGDIKMVPGEVAIAGHPEDIGNIHYVYVNSIDLTGRTESFTQQVDMIVQNGVRWMSLSSAEISVEISEQTRTTVISNIPVEFINELPGVTIKPEADVVTVAIDGPASFINSLRRQDIRAYVNLISATTGEYEFEVEFEFAGENVPKLSISRASLKVEILPAEDE